MIDKNRETLMEKLQTYNFAMADAALFLDTHPNDSHALAYWKKYQELTKNAEKEYAEMYGPISADDTDKSTTRWTWVDGPWPWEREER